MELADSRAGARSPDNHAGHLIDGRDGSVRDASIVIEGTTITRVERAVTNPTYDLSRPARASGFNAVFNRRRRCRHARDQFRAGSVLLAGDKVLIIREAGEMILASAPPQAFRPIARAQILNGVVRPYPAVADGFLYVRNENSLVCLDLRRQ